MAVSGPFLFKAGIAFLVGKLAGALLSKDKRASIDNKKPTLASRGDFVPLLIGCRSLSPIVLWVGDRTTTSEGNAGGKGVTGGGGSQLVYRESAWHALCIGPARKLKKIRENDKIIWESIDTDPSLTRGITPETHPSGSTISVSGHGSFRIFWGEADQPINTRLGDPSRVGYNSRHKFLCYVEWIQKRLGGTAAWPQLEYEIECHPYKTGDTYAYTGPYDGIHGLPERLAQSDGWVPNGIGGGYPIPILTAEDGDPGIIKLANNVAGVGNTMARIEGNSALADGRYDLDSVVYNASETLRAPSGVYLEIPGTQADFNTWTAGTGVIGGGADPTSARPPNAVPFGFAPNDVFEMNLTNPHTGLKEMTFDIAGFVSNQKLSPGINHIRLWVRGFNVGVFTQFRVQLYAYGHPSLSDNVHELQFDADPSGFPITTETNGAYGTIVSVGQSTPGGGPSHDWWQVDFYYRSGTGTTPSDDNWKRRLKIRFVKDNENHLWLYANDPHTSPSHIREDALLSDDDGTVITGITTVQTTQPLTGSNYAAGNLFFLRVGAGHDGANIAHTLDQLLFEEAPHGQGLNRSLWDSDSLEEVGVRMGLDGEGLRTHVLVDDGSTLEGIVANILLDAGLVISWDPTQGKYTFKLLRDPGADPVITIPALAINAPLPEITTILDAGVPDKKIYMFPDRDLNYRPSPANSTDDDGRSAREERQNEQKEELYIVTDIDAANQIAARREQYDMSPPATIEMQVGRAARRLVPGIPVFVEGIEERLRLMEVGPPENTSMRVAIKANTDASFNEV